MKKLIIPIIFGLLLTACQPTVIVSGDNSSKGFQTTYSDTEIIPLSRFTDEGLYSFEVNYSISPKTYLTFIDAATATQVPLCNAPSCEHNTKNCTAVFDTLGHFYSYKDNLLYFSDGRSNGYDDDVKYGSVTQAASIIMADATGGNRKTIGTVSNEFYGSFPEAVYGDNLIFATMAEDGTVISSMNIKTGEGKQISIQALSNSSAFLGFYKNNILFSNSTYNTDSIVDKISSLNADDGGVTELTTISRPYSLANQKNETVYYKYYNGKIYQYNANTLKGMDILSSIDCETGKTELLCDNIIDESYFGQSIYSIINDVLIIDSPQKGDDKNQPISRRFSYNLKTGEQGEISLFSKEPVQGEIHPVNIVSEMGDNLYVEQSHEYAKFILNDLDGNPTEVEDTTITYAIMSKADYLNSTPNFTTIAK